MNVCIYLFIINPRQKDPRATYTVGSNTENTQLIRTLKVQTSVGQRSFAFYGKQCVERGDSNLLSNALY